MSSSAVAGKSALSCCAAPAGTNWLLPPPSPSPRLPRNWTLSAMICTACRLPEPSVASHSRQSSRPSMPTGLPFGSSLLFRGSVLGLGALRNGRFGLGRLGLGRLGRRRHGRGGVAARRARARAGDVARRQVAQHSVVDLEDTGHLVERCRLRVEDDEVVDAFLLVRDRIREASPAPGVVAVPRAAVLLDEVARASDDVVLAGLSLLGVQHQQNFVSRHAPMSSLPMVSMSAPTAGAARD